MTTIALRGDAITLSQAVKAAGLADSGGQAKMLVRSGTVRVNGQVETRPGRKLGVGDSFRMADGPVWTIAGHGGEGDSSARPGNSWELPAAGQDERAR